MLKRTLDLKPVLEKKSCFLFGPRQTGKTTLIEAQFPDAQMIQLLDAETHQYLLMNPSRLNDIIKPNQKTVVIDEIQKLPELLDQIHLLIEKRKINFLLTGSNPRKLKRVGVNLLGGRARRRNLYPLTSLELGDQFKLEQVLKTGAIPSIYFSDSPWEDLKSYALEYITQEIAAEGLSRNIPAFSRFVEVAALSNAQLINYSAIASDAEVKRTTVQNYFQILEETLVGYNLKPWKKSKNRKAIGAEKFYFFDTGLVNVLSGRKSITPKTPEWGFLFETFILNELRAFGDYRQTDLELSYWKSTSGFEVDLIINDEIAIEIKSKENVSARDLKGLLALQDEKKFKRLICICLGRHRSKIGSIELIPHQDFLNELWASELLSAK